MKLLLAVDGSDHTRRMLAWMAANEGQFLRCGYTFITVAPPLPPHVTHHLGHAVLEGHYRDQANEVLVPVIEFARRHHWPFETRSPVGRPAEQIAEAAVTEGFDLIVMGSHGHSALAGLALGSVVQRVLAACKTPVLIVR